MLKLMSARFFVLSILSVTQGRIDMILDVDSSALDILETAFGGL